MAEKNCWGTQDAAQRKPHTHMSLKCLSCTSKMSCIMLAIMPAHFHNGTCTYGKQNACCPQLVQALLQAPPRLVQALLQAPPLIGASIITSTPKIGASIITSTPQEWCKQYCRHPQDWCNHYYNHPQDWYRHYCRHYYMVENF